MTTEICFWLGTQGDGDLRHPEPAEEHLCYAQEPEAPVDLDYEVRFCLTGEHRTCQFYRERPEPPTVLSEPAPTVLPGPDVAGDGGGSSKRRLSMLRLLPWIAAAIVLAVVLVTFGSTLLGPGPTATPSITPAAEATLTPTPTFSPTPTATAEPAVLAPSPTFEFEEPTGTPTPYPGGAIYSLSPRPGAAGWVASDEERGNHFGDSYLYAGVYDGVIYHGALQFDLAAVPRGAPIEAAVLELTGLNAGRLGETGVWEVRVLAREADEGWARATYQDVHNAEVIWSLAPSLGVADLYEGRSYAFELPGELRDALEQRLLDEHYTLSLRVDGPLTGANSVFAWDTGSGPTTRDRPPRLVLNVGPPPSTPIPTGSPPPTATPDWVVVTSSPTPANAVTAAAIAVQQTAWATSTGLPTATPLFVATATPRYVYVTNTPTPANSATAAYAQQLATAKAVLTGTPTATPPNVATIVPVVLPWRPTPANVLTAAAIAAEERAQAASTGTATPTPTFAVTATPEYVVVTHTPTPENLATAEYRELVAAAWFVLTGSPTPAPHNLATATFTPLPTGTPLPTRTPVLVWEDEMTPEATYTPTPTPTPISPIPEVLRGKIAFLSDRRGEEEPTVWVLDPGTGRLGLLTARWPYERAKELERFSPDGKFVLSVRPSGYFVPAKGEVEEDKVYEGFQVYVTDLSNNYSSALTFSRISYDPVWSPRGDLIAYVSQEEEDNWQDAYGSGGDEIYVITPQGQDKRRLTENVWEWDKHPSFSPDGSQIVYWSNQGSGLRQLWIVNVDGSGRRVLMYSDYNDWDPVWIK